MIDDFQPIIHKLRGRPIKLWAVGDVHIGAKEADISGFEAFLKRVQADEDSYLIVVGDVLNFGVRDSVSDVYAETMPPSAQIEYATELLYPTKDRILACVGGNHEHRGVKSVDLDPLYQVMVMLRIPELYRQNFAFLRVILLNGNICDRYALYLTHGKSAAKQKKFSESAIEGVDAIVCGHTHTGSLTKNARLVFNESNRIFVKSQVSVTACSWLKYGGYASRSQCLPTVTSNPQALLLDYTGSNASKGKIQVIW